MTRTVEGTGAIPIVHDVRRGTRQAGSAEVSLWIDPSEHDRRRDLGMGALQGGVDLFSTLLRLPLGAWTSAAALEPFELELVLAVRGAVDWDGRQVRRIAVPPTDPTMATVSHPSWRQAMRTAGRFAPYCARRVLIPARAADDTELLLEASYWGVGVRVREEDGSQVELAPAAQFQARRYTGASWLFAEQLYGSYLTHQGSR